MAEGILEMAFIFKAVDNLSTATARMGAGMTTLQTRTQKLGFALKQMGAAVMPLVGFAMYNFAKDTVNMYMEFDHAMVKVAALSGELERNSDTWMEFSDTVRELGRTTEFTASQVAGAAGFMAMAGFELTETTQGLAQVLDLATVGFVDVSTAADITTNIMTGFGLEVEDLTRVNDALAQTFTSSNTNLQMLGETMKYAAPVAHAAGWSLEETAAAAGLLGSAGIQGCYDEETEVLTKDGFKFWKDVTENDEFLTLNPDTKEMEYQRPSKLFKYEHKDKMLRVKNRHIDLLVTPNHNMYVKLRYRKDFELIQAKDIIGKEIEFTKYGKWKGKDSKYFTLKGFMQNKGFYNRKIEDKKIKMDDWVEFLGYYFSEGCIVKSKKGDYTITITQNEGIISKKMEDVIKRMGFSCDHYRTQYRIRNHQLFKCLDEYGRRENKKIPQYVKDLSPRLLKIFYEAYRDGDGDDNGAIYTSSVYLRDAMEEIIMKIGWGIKHTQTLKKGDKAYIKDHWATVSRDGWKINVNKKQLTPGYTISDYRGKHGKRLTGIGTKIKQEWIDYEGYVYCAEVPNHVLFIRRNGKTVFCGNSMAGTALRMSLVQILSPSGDAQAVMEKLGLSLIDTSGNVVSMVEILRQLEQSGATTAEIMELFGARAGGAMLALKSQGSAALQDFTKTIYESEGATKQMAETIRASAKGQWLEMQSRVEDVKLAMGEALYPVVLELANLFADTLAPIMKDTVVPIMSDMIPIVETLANVLNILLKPLVGQEEILSTLVYTLLLYKAGMAAAALANSTFVGSMVSSRILPMLTALNARLSTSQKAAAAAGIAVGGLTMAYMAWTAESDSARAAYSVMTGVMFGLAAASFLAAAGQLSLASAATLGIAVGAIVAGITYGMASMNKAKKEAGEVQGQSGAIIESSGIMGVHAGERVVKAADVRREGAPDKFGGMGGGDTYNITVNAGYGSDKDIVRLAVLQGIKQAKIDGVM